jgi:hypothetical protein
MGRTKYHGTLRRAPDCILTCVTCRKLVAANRVEPLCSAAQDVIGHVEMRPSLEHAALVRELEGDHIVQELKAPSWRCNLCTLRLVCRTLCDAADACKARVGRRIWSSSPAGTPAEAHEALCKRTPHKWVKRGAPYACANNCAAVREYCVRCRACRPCTEKLGRDAAPRFERATGSAGLLALGPDILSRIVFFLAPTPCEVLVVVFGFQNVGAPGGRGLGNEDSGHPFACAMEWPLSILMAEMCRKLGGHRPQNELALVRKVNARERERERDKER